MGNPPLVLSLAQRSLAPPSQLISPSTNVFTNAYFVNGAAFIAAMVRNSEGEIAFVKIQRMVNNIPEAAEAFTL